MFANAALLGFLDHSAMLNKNRSDRDRDRDRDRGRDRDRDRDRGRDRSRRRDRSRSRDRHDESDSDEEPSDPVEAEKRRKEKEIMNLTKDQRTVFVSQLTQKVKEKHLKRYFSKVGKVSSSSCSCAEIPACLADHCSF